MNAFIRDCKIDGLQLFLADTQNICSGSMHQQGLLLLDPTVSNSTVVTLQLSNYCNSPKPGCMCQTIGFPEGFNSIQHVAAHITSTHCIINDYVFSK